MECKLDESFPSQLILFPSLFHNLSMDMSVYSMMLTLGEDATGGRKSFLLSFGSMQNLLKASHILAWVYDIPYASAGLSLNFC